MHAGKFVGDYGGGVYTCGVLLKEYANNTSLRIHLENFLVVTD